MKSVDATSTLRIPSYKIQGSFSKMWLKRKFVFLPGTFMVYAFIYAVHTKSKVSMMLPTSVGPWELPAVPGCQHIGGGHIETDTKSLKCKQTFWKQVNSSENFQQMFYNTSIHLEYERAIMGTPFQHLKNFQNPCWVAAVNASASNVSAGVPGPRLRCFPALFLLGFAKAGSTDLYNSLVRHPTVFPGRAKESQYWAWRRLAVFDKHVDVPDTFTQYIDDYDNASEAILHQHEKTSGSDKPVCGVTAQDGCVDIDTSHYYQGITLDGTPSNIYLYDGWEKMPGHENLTEPNTLLAHTIRAIYPQAKFIIMLRNPTDRTYSHFRQRARFDSVSVFDRDMQVNMEVWDKCLQVRSRRSCLYNSTLYAASRHYLGGSYLRPSLYVLYLKDWLQVFPRKQFYFIKSEEYYNNRTKILTDIFKFLELDEMTPQFYEGLDEAPIANYRKHKGESREPITNETRQILDKFYKPYTEELAQLLGDEKFLWKDIVL